LKRFLFIFILSFVVIALAGQQPPEYSVDFKKIEKTKRETKILKIDKKTQKLNQKKQKIAEKQRDDYSKAIKNAHKNNQTRATQKNMKQSYKMAQKFNKGKPQLTFSDNVNWQIKKFKNNYALKKRTKQSFKMAQNHNKGKPQVSFIDNLKFQINKKYGKRPF